MFTQYTKTFNVVLFAILTVVIMVIHNAANAASYEDKARALSTSFTTYCNNYVANKSPSKVKVRAYMKARLIERQAGAQIRGCKGNSSCRKAVRYDFIKKLHNSLELKKAGYFGWSPATFEAVKAEAARAGFREQLIKSLTPFGVE